MFEREDGEPFTRRAISLRILRASRRILGKDAAITATELAEKILPAADIFAALDAAVTDPNVRRMRFGEAQTLGMTLWRMWDPQRSLQRCYLVF